MDNGYDIADYYTIDPTYGTKADFDIFLKEAHKRGIKVIMDMVLNHTSTDCKWFQESKKSKDNPYRDYYIWKDKPNNWESFFGGTAWQKDAATNQYYYHKFDVRMADLNWANPKVVGEVQKVLRFWLDAGVDGFRLDVINFLTINGVTQDNPVEDGKQDHKNDIDQPGVKDSYPTLFFGSHDMPRMIDRLANGDPEKAEALATLLLTAKGVPFIYYGEEIGMHNTIAHNFTDIKDIQGITHYKLAIAKGKKDDEALIDANEHNRDKSRSPMQWSNDNYAGFSTKKSWIKVNPDYEAINVKSLNKNSILNIYKKLIALRNDQEVLQYGLYTELEHNNGLIKFTRTFKNQSITVIINFGIFTEVELPSGATILMGNTSLKTNNYIVYKT